MVDRSGLISTNVLGWYQHQKQIQDIVRSSLIRQFKFINTTFFYLFISETGMYLKEALVKTVNQKDKSTMIWCNIQIQPPISWTFNGRLLSKTYVSGRDQCDDLSGPFPVKDGKSVVVCNLNYTLHQGNYTCYTDLLKGVSSTTTLTIEGNKCLCDILSSLK